MNVVEPIDVVVTWVDDTDLTWRALRDFHLGDQRKTREGAADARFRDWGALRYWFRAIEENCEWVRNVVLVTVNPLPAWLNLNHPRLRVIHHEDFIPSVYLPTFNSRVIELHLHRIAGLSEKFVYFNDDQYVLKKITREHFFPEGNPAAIPVMNALSVGDNISHAMLNNIRIINENFSKRRVIGSNFPVWFNPRNGIALIQNLALVSWKRFTGFHNHHLPLALEKATFCEVWERAEKDLAFTSESKFRQFHDVNPFLFSYWQLCTGRFTAVTSKKYGKYMQMGETPRAELLREIVRPHAPVVCVNDGDVDDYDEYSRDLEKAFKIRFPSPSSFERS